MKDIKQYWFIGAFIVSVAGGWATLESRLNAHRYVIEQQIVIIEESRDAIIALQINQARLEAQTQCK